MEIEPIQTDKLLLCRLCLANGFNSTFIIQSPENEAILKKYNISFMKKDLRTADDEFLIHICEVCWNKVIEFEQFYEQIENIQSIYEKNFLKDDGTYVSFEDPSQYYMEVDSIHSQFKLELNETVVEEDKKSTYIEPFCTINVDFENDCKVLPENHDLKLNSNEEPSVKPEITKVEIVECNEPEIEALDNNKDVLFSDNESERNFETSFSDDEYDYNGSDDTSEDEVEEKTKKRTKMSPKSDKKQPGTSRQSNKSKGKITVQATMNFLGEDTQKLLRYVQLKCDICSDNRTFESFSDIQVHFSDAHNRAGYVICCNRKFRRIGRVLQHCTWHDNPEAFKCDECSKCFQDNVCLRDHITSMHVPNDKRHYQCEQCSKLFAKKHLLNTHLKMKHTVKEERPYVCSEMECGQRFVLPAYLRLHIEKVHNKSDSRVCDVCARFFKCSKSYERHYQVEHTNIDQRVQCDLCRKWFKHLDTLKDHIRRHYAATETCKYCGRVSSNKKSLRLHIRNVHADIDSSVKTRNEFPCSVCGKIFKKKQTLREHTTLHTGEAFLYTCTFCSKTFRSSANMYAHRKRTHPREYEEKCVLAKMQKT